VVNPTLEKNLPGVAPHTHAARAPGSPFFGGIGLPSVLNSHAAGASVFSTDHHATAVEQVGHCGDEFAAVAGAGSYDRDQFTEAVFGFVDFFVDIFHRNFPFAVFDSIRNANVQKRFRNSRWKGVCVGKTAAGAAQNNIADA
jgi:hypothetical protein